MAGARVNHISKLHHARNVYPSTVDFKLTNNRAYRLNYCFIRIRQAPAVYPLKKTNEKKTVCIYDFNSKSVQTIEKRIETATCSYNYYFRKSVEKKRPIFIEMRVETLDIK